MVNGKQYIGLSGLVGVEADGDISWFSGRAGQEEVVISVGMPTVAPAPPPTPSPTSRILIPSRMGCSSVERVQMGCLYRHYSCKQVGMLSNVLPVQFFSLDTCAVGVDAQRTDVPALVMRFCAQQLLENVEPRRLCL